ncbi:hypothetical protein ACLUW2_04365 [Limosilactobacillus balticus]|uniref:hypothetical protein n=1 Tax=Limosilactobacillus balticus TaxID=2759747 RepID=UPI003992E8BA
MVKIDFAYCPKIGNCIDAVKANELWLDGILNDSDKRKFVCPGKTCSAQITCANMDKTKIEQVRAPYFVFTKRSETVHAPKCDFEEQVELLREKQDSETRISQENCDQISFRMNRPEDTKTMKLSISSYLSNEDKNDDNRELPEAEHAKRQITHSNYYLLSSLIDKYLIALKEDKLDRVRVLIEYPEKGYTYKLSTLFKRIHNIGITKDLKGKTKIFYGKASIKYNRDKTGYWISFQELFKTSKKEVLCFINAETIKNTVNYQFKERNLLKNNVDRELYVFIMGKVKETEKNVYINIDPNNLDMMAVSIDDILLTKSFIEG